MRAAASLVMGALAACVSAADYGDRQDPAVPPDGPVPPHDEDGDGVADPRDLCPTVASVGADADGDGVGDECDPQAAAANQIVYYDGFAGPFRWQSEGNAMWTATDGALETVRLADEGATRTLETIAGPLRLVATATVVEIDAQPGLSWFDAFTTEPQSGDECQLAGGALINGGRDGRATESMPLAESLLVPDRTITLVMQREAGAIRCAVDGVQVVRAAAAAPSAMFRIGVRRMRLRVHSVIAYSVVL